MLDFNLSSEATITVEAGFQANNFWAPAPDYFARIDSFEVVDYKINSLQTFQYIEVYDERFLSYYYEALEPNYALYGNTDFHESIIFSGKGIVSGELQIDIGGVREYFFEPKRYIFEDLQIEFEQFTLLDERSTVTSDLFGFDVSGSIYAQQGFPNFRTVVIITTTGVPIQTNRHIWIH